MRYANYTEALAALQRDYEAGELSWQAYEDYKSDLRRKYGRPRGLDEAETLPETGRNQDAASNVIPFPITSAA